MPQVNVRAVATAGAGATAILLACVAAIPKITHWEGRENVPYQDMARRIWTVCDGETKDVVPGRYYSDAECETILAKRVVEFGTSISQCLPQTTPQGVRTSFIVSAWNIGAGDKGFCSSSMARYAQAGNYPAACDALMAWNKARVNGQLVPVKGLTRRRCDERKDCFAGLGRAAPAHPACAAVGA